MATRDDSYDDDDDNKDNNNDNKDNNNFFLRDATCTKRESVPEEHVRPASLQTGVAEGTCSAQGLSSLARPVKFLPSDSGATTGSHGSPKEYGGPLHFPPRAVSPTKKDVLASQRVIGKGGATG